MAITTLNSLLIAIGGVAPATLFAEIEEVPPVSRLLNEMFSSSHQPYLDESLELITTLSYFASSTPLSNQMFALLPHVASIRSVDMAALLSPIDNIVSRDPARFVKSSAHINSLLALCERGLSSTTSHTPDMRHGGDDAFASTITSCRLLESVLANCIGVLPQNAAAHILKLVIQKLQVLQPNNVAGDANDAMKERAIAFLLHIVSLSSYSSCALFVQACVELQCWSWLYPLWLSHAGRLHSGSFRKVGVLGLVSLLVWAGNACHSRAFLTQLNLHVQQLQRVLCSAIDILDESCTARIRDEEELLDTAAAGVPHDSVPDGATDAYSLHDKQEPLMTDASAAAAAVPSSSSNTLSLLDLGNDVDFMDAKEVQMLRQVAKQHDNLNELQPMRPTNDMDKALHAKLEEAPADNDEDDDDDDDDFESPIDDVDAFYFLGSSIQGKIIDCSSRK